MKTLEIKLVKSDILAEVEKLTGYVALKATSKDNPSGNYQAMVSLDDKDMLETFWKDACNTITTSLMRYLATDEAAQSYIDSISTDWGTGSELQGLQSLVGMTSDPSTLNDPDEFGNNTVKYYNTSTKKLYSNDSNNIAWINPQDPSATIKYTFGGKTYYWNGTDLKEIDQFSLILAFPDNIHTSMGNILRNYAYQYAVHYIVYRWFAITNRPDAEYYAKVAAQHLDNITSTSNMRSATFTRSAGW